MHIPDGYLSPATCATLYAGAAPFWYVAMQRVRRALNTRLIPLISLFAAFSFVIMMFNLPLPGGTTGHAAGVAVTAIVLGPWASILAISTALLIQAVFFGDGGITALGANCFNMAIMGSLIAYAAYRAIAGRSALTSRRRVVAAAVAGYAAINIAALCAAIEFGIQPMFFRDATGAPLYAPYGLRVAIPAMMIGHLTFAGLAELILSAGLVAYLQRTNVALLARTRSPERVADEPAGLAADGGWCGLRPLWIALAALLLLTPLGVLAVGTAWGEWTVHDFQNATARQHIAVASTNEPLPAQAPRGLRRLSSVWTAPFPAYAPAIVRNQALGYMLSAMFGAGLVILLTTTAARFASRRMQADDSHGA